MTSEDNEGQFIRSTSADQFYASEHCRALGERNRHADSVIREQGLRQAEASVEFFLVANRDYARTKDDRDQMLRSLKDRNLPISRRSTNGSTNSRYRLIATPDTTEQDNRARLAALPDAL